MLAKLRNALFLVSSLMMISNTAFAHAGHDHSAWSSSLIHVLFYGAILSVVAGGVYLIRSKRKASDKGE